MKKYPLWVLDADGSPVMHMSYPPAVIKKYREQLDEAMVVLLEQFKGRGDRPRPRNQDELDEEIARMVHFTCSIHFPDVWEEDLRDCYNMYEKATVKKIKRNIGIGVFILVAAVTAYFVL